MELSAYEAGITPDVFYESTLVEVQLIIQAYQQRETEAWRRARLQAYTVYCSVTESGKRDSIYEFFKLHGDPESAISEEEEGNLMEMYEQQMKWMDQNEQKPNNLNG